jgi:hypothetical protein
VVVCPRCPCSCGTLDAIEAAADAVRDAAGDRLVGRELIAQPSPDLRGRLFR